MGRFLKGGIKVDSDEYLLHLSKYIHKNPSEAKMVDRLAAYRWSSYPSYIGQSEPKEWLSTAEVYDQLGGDKTKAKRYQRFVEETESDGEVNAFYAKQRFASVLGSKEFKEAVAQRYSGSNIEAPRKTRLRVKPSIDAIVSMVAEEYQCEEAVILRLRRGRGLSNFPRKVAMYFAQLVGDYKLTEIADHFGLRHYGGVASAIHCVKSASQADRKIKQKLNSIIKRFDP